jgi:hypothetical protein
VELQPAPHVAARTSAATALVMAGATLAHTWAGGHLPEVPALLVLAGVVHGAGFLVLRWRVPVVLLVPFVLVAQTGLHGMFGLLGPMDAHAGHAQIAAASLGGASFTWQMAVAHLVSTLLTVLVWALAQRAATVVLRALGWWLEYGAVRRDVARCLPAALGRTSSLDCLVWAPRRGPPVRFA